MQTSARTDGPLSAEETRDSRQAILQLELELQKAQRLLAETQTRIATLKRQLDYHKGRVAPIRRLPFETLTEIFRVCCTEWMSSPFKLAAICHQWRDIVFANPVLWTRISDNMPSSYTSALLKHSGSRPLHVKLLEECPGCQDSSIKEDSFCVCRCQSAVMLIEPTSIQRIQCMSINSVWMYRLARSRFINVTQLRLDSSISQKKHHILFMQRGRFPMLKCLEIQAQNLSTIGFEHRLLDFPPLEELRCQTDNGDVWIKLVNLCAKSLKSLALSGKFHNPKASVTVVKFPKLINLEVHEQAAPWGVQLLQATAPALVTYSHHPFFESGPPILHNSTHTVVHLKTSRLVDLESYPSLRILQLCDSGPLMAYINQLWQRIDICPALKEIRIPDLESTKSVDMASVRMKLEERGRRWGIFIRLAYSEGLKHTAGEWDVSSCC